MTAGADGRLGLAHFSAIGLPPIELVRAANVAGFSHVGLRLIPPFPGAPHYPIAADSDEAKSLQRVLDGEGISVHDIEAVVIDPEFRADALVPALEAARTLGARRLNVAADDPEWPRLTDNFSSLCEIAAGYGLAVDFENMGWRTVATYSQSLQVVKRSGASNACVLVDALHFFRNGGSASDLSGNERWTASLQLCDVRGPSPQRNEDRVAEARSGRFAPGEGELPLLDLVHALHDWTVVSVEVPMNAASVSPIDHIQRLASAARSVLDRAEGNATAPPSRKF
jgi:sugar phosphate isomerase/epimerase